MKYKVGDMVKPTLSEAKGKKAIITRVYDHHYDLKFEDGGIYPVFWTDEIIEGVVEEDEIAFDAGVFEQWSHEFLCPDGYEFRDEKGNVIEAKKIVLEKKPKHPKSYEECLKVLNIPYAALYIQQPPRYNYKLDLLLKFQTLLICRDAYWKIAGEEMGLGKPWEPDWQGMPTKYVLNNDNGKIVKNAFWYSKQILGFPTEEMRDAFYESFKKLIEECKELL